MRASSGLALAAWVWLCLAGCTMAPSVGPTACSDDSQCEEGQLCFPGGCGAPEKDIVVEVTANTRAGLHAQDFPITNLSLTQDIEIFPAFSLVGDISQRRYSSGDPFESAEPYRAPVTVRAVGESLLIPGVTRRYEATFSSLEQGAYSMFIGAGSYTVTATAADTSIPADTRPGVVVSAGQAASQSFVFERSPGTTFGLSAMLVKTKALPPARETLLTTKMEVRAFDAEGKKPLSQPAPVNRDDGAFTLWIDPAIEDLDSFVIVASPSDPASVAPSKRFVIPRPIPAQLVLEMGAFGQSLPGITGVIRGPGGQPIGGAAVFIEGLVGGGGTFRTRTVTTDDQGIFKVEAFLSAEGSNHTLTAIPPPTGSAGIFRGTVQVLSRSVEGYLSPDFFYCPSRVQVTGTLLRPDGLTPAANTKVVAEPIASIDNGPLPPNTVEGNTDYEGHFSLTLDPAEYRFDFLPGEGLPRRSRFVSVRAEPTRSDTLGSLELSPYTLAKGRKLTGTISSAQDTQPSTSGALPYASVRFFRKTSIAGKPSAILLAETVADERGNYQVVLPAR